LNSIWPPATVGTRQQYIGKGSKKDPRVTRVPKWAYLMIGILIVISGILAFAIVTAVFSLLGRPALWEIDIQVLLLYVILPLGILTILMMLITAILLTRKWE
jgi:hypothetical protein